MSRPQNLLSSSLLILTCLTCADSAGLPCWQVPPAGTACAGVSFSASVSARLVSWLRSIVIVCIALRRLPGDETARPPSPHGKCTSTVDPSDRCAVSYTLKTPRTVYVPEGRSSSDAFEKP